jgi:hypothetical protein
MATILLLHIEIDDTKPLGPQVMRARLAGVPWKTIEDKTGYSRWTLRDLMYDTPERVITISVGSRARLAAAS